MNCPLCGRRKARRACPALAQQICTVCCGTKRLVEIHCPSDCPYLTSSREHPPAVLVRQQQDDLGVIGAAMNDLSDPQARLFFLLMTFLAPNPTTRSASVAPSGFQLGLVQTATDEDVVEAVAALAATYETAARGVIYEHRAASPGGERLAHELTQLLTEAGRDIGSSSFSRDAAVVLRRLASAARQTIDGAEANPHAFLNRIARVVREEAPHADADDQPEQASRIIMP